MSILPTILPRIAAEVPVQYVTGHNRPFARSLALALLKGRTITKEDASMLNASSGELQLSQITLNRVWSSITSRVRSFDWTLRIVGEKNDPDAAWLTVASRGGPSTAPIRTIGAGIMRLEDAAAGLGQTVLAVLYEACSHYLPAVCTPQEAIGLAEYMYWYGEVDEFGALEELSCCHDMAMPDRNSEQDVAEFFAACDTPRRAEFFSDAPEWACYPQRVLTAEQVSHVRNFATDQIYVDLIADTCDKIHECVTSCGPFAQVGAVDAMATPIDYGMYVRWSEDDSTTRILDDHWHYATQGETLDAMTCVRFSMKGGDISRWLRRMDSTARLAEHVEELIMMLSGVHPIAARVRV
ncbi:PRTRC system protein F [Burkholderia glumae]|uniref:PRTRC system protein F n=1 Tax=Burkholderia glumae TaxID=337 RepID=UPI0009B721CB|nr:PRTRC system protein F [Burkholderia glumae]MCR1769031.1 PRTRC system protein F [Burkholderia glumae]